MTVTHFELLVICRHRIWDGCRVGVSPPVGVVSSSGFAMWQGSYTKPPISRTSSLDSECRARLDRVSFLESRCSAKDSLVWEMIRRTGQSWRK